MKIILGLVLCFWAVQKYRTTARQLHIINKFAGGSQPVMIKILKKSRNFRKRYHFFQLDESVAELCFTGEILIDGMFYKTTVIAPPHTNIGKTYLMNGFYYPVSKLFIPSNDAIYHYKVRKYSFPYLFPSVIMYRTPSET